MPYMIQNAAESDFRQIVFQQRVPVTYIRGYEVISISEREYFRVLFSNLYDTIVKGINDEQDTSND